MAHGIICIETEWQITKRANRLNLNSEPLMKFISEMYGIPYIYRRVATKDEFQYYLHQFSKKEYANKYDIIYLSFHGQTHAIHLEGEKEDLSLDELIEMGGSVFENRFVHLSSCRTLIGSSSTAISFKEKTGAKLLSGYSKSVDGALSAVHDIALFGEYLQRVRLSCIAKNMEKNFGELEKTLGFVLFK